MFGGKINPSLLDLKHLIYLDLSFNDFNYTPIPKFLGSMGSLRYLNLSHAGFGGLIPHQLGNLSNLHYLNLGDNNLYVMNLQWLSGLPLLQHLDLSSNNFFGSIPASIGSLINLESLHLHNNKFSKKLLSSLKNFKDLLAIDIGENEFVGSIPKWIGYILSRLMILRLPSNNFCGQITSLQILDLSHNKLFGSIPKCVNNFSMKARNNNSNYPFFCLFSQQLIVLTLLKVNIL